jgi:hypothetical protein
LKLLKRVSDGNFVIACIEQGENKTKEIIQLNEHLIEQSIIVVIFFAPSMVLFVLVLVVDVSILR